MIWYSTYFSERKQVQRLSHQAPNILPDLFAFFYLGQVSSSFLGGYSVDHVLLTPTVIPLKLLRLSSGKLNFTEIILEFTKQHFKEAGNVLLQETAKWSSFDKYQKSMGQPPPVEGVGPASCFCDRAFSSISLLLLFMFFSFIAVMTGGLEDTAVVGRLLR